MRPCEDRANRGGPRCITPANESSVLVERSEGHVVQPFSERRPVVRSGGLVLTVGVALILAGCGGSGPAASTGAPASASSPSTTGGPSSASTGAPSAAPTSTIARLSVKAVPAEAPLKLLWEKAGPTPLAGATSAIAVAPDGRVFPVSAHDNVIWTFKPDGTYLASIGGPGSKPGQFDFSDGHNPQNVYGSVAFEPDGAFFVGDTGHSRVQAFDKDGAFVKVIGTFGTGAGQLAQPVGIAVDAHGNIYVGDNSRNDIQEFSRDGTVIKDFSEGIDYTNSQAAQVAVDPAGNVFTTVGRTVVELAPDGRESAEFDLSAYGYPDGLVTDAKGNLWIPTDTTSGSNSQPGPLVEMDGHGAVLHVWPMTGDLVALDPTGTAIYVAFFQRATVQKYALVQP